MSSALSVELWHKLLRRGRAQTDLAAFSHSKLMLGCAGCVWSKPGPAEVTW